MCAHTYPHAHKEASICVYYIYCGMCVHCPSSSSRCWSSPLLLRFWLPRQQNKKYKKKSCISSLCLALFFSLLSISLVFRPAVSSLSLSLASSLACFVHFYAFALFVISLSAISTLALSHAVAAVLALSLSPPLTLPLIIHWTNDCAPLCPTHIQKHIPLLHHSPLHFAHSLSPHSLDDLHDDATYNSNRLKRKTNKNELNRKA